jgi:hypothetical protein|tara:strand:+ start:807 stop:1133 length:327 start_codon:yes stop_codon:yes gene_type:complete
MDVIEGWIKKPDSFLSNMTLTELFEMEEEYAEKIMKEGKDMKMYLGIIHAILKPFAIMMKRDKSFISILNKVKDLTDVLIETDDVKELNKIAVQQKEMVDQILGFFEV